jgi:IS5 family transposase
MRAFAGLELGRDAIPDETTILNFRHLLERHELTKAVFTAVAELLEARGALLRGGTIVDATLIAASSTKNAAQTGWEYEMRCERHQALCVDLKIRLDGALKQLHELLCLRIHIMAGEHAFLCCLSHEGQRSDGRIETFLHGLR